MTAPSDTQSFELALEDICYRMYETSGNGKYIRAEWANKPYHPDTAVADIKAKFAALITQVENLEYHGPAREEGAFRLEELRKRL